MAVLLPASRRRYMQSEAHAENVVLPTFGGQLHP
jgi:hypothetical protein